MNPQDDFAAAAEATSLAAEIVSIMDALEPVLEEETALARAGRLASAAALHARKSELAAGYLTASQRLKAQARRLPPAARELLTPARARHERLRAALQLNMTVIATAHAVAEDLIRGAAAQVATSRAPQTYGASGRANTPPPRKAGPVAVNRSC
jgi:hypothetical protein